MMPGYTFTLKDHYRGSFNQSYLVTDVSHEGNQTGYLLAGITMGTGGEGGLLPEHFLLDRVDCPVPAGADGGKPRISGTLTAKIDAAGPGNMPSSTPRGATRSSSPSTRRGGRTGRLQPPTDGAALCGEGPRDALPPA